MVKVRHKASMLSGHLLLFLVYPHKMYKISKEFTAQNFVGLRIHVDDRSKVKSTKIQ